MHWGDTWKNPPTEVLFDADEYIMGIESRDPVYPISMMFLTNKRSYGPYGRDDWNGGVPIRRMCQQNKRLYSIDGRKGWYYEHINFNFR